MKMMKLDCYTFLINKYFYDMIWITYMRYFEILIWKAYLNEIIIWNDDIYMKFPVHIEILLR